MKKIILILCLALVKPLLSFGQNYNPVFIPIQNIKQQNPNWCWAAVAEQLVAWKKHRAPKQCDIVSGYSQELKFNCCDTPSACNNPGSISEVQSVLTKFGIQYSAMLPLPNALSLYNIISNDHAVVMFLQSSSTIGHCVVIMGMEGNTVYVNDPTGKYMSVPLETILSLWSVAIAI